MRVLITRRTSSNTGGVVNFLDTLWDHFQVEVESFTIGARRSNEGAWRVIKRLFSDSWNLHKRLERGDIRIVQLNPSLLMKAVFRDGILLLIAKRHGCKVVVFFHGWNEQFEERLRRSFIRLFRIIFHKADAFVVLASTFADKLKTLGIDKPIHVLTTAVDEKFDDLFNPEEALETRENDTFRILFLARIEKPKGVYETVDAYRIVREKHPNVRLVIAGDGSELGPLKEYVEEKKIPHIDFPGYVHGDIKYKLFAESDLYLLPTWHGEGLPVSVLEAMAAGLPVITRPIGGLIDILIEGKTGFITESRSANVFADLIERLISDETLRLRIGRFNRDYAIKHFLSSKVAKKLDEIYEQVIA